MKTTLIHDTQTTGLVESGACSLTPLVLCMRWAEVLVLRTVKSVQKGLSLCLASQSAEQNSRSQNSLAIIKCPPSHDWFMYTQTCCTGKLRSVHRWDYAEALFPFLSLTQVVWTWKPRIKEGAPSQNQSNRPCLMLFILPCLVLWWM